MRVSYCRAEPDVAVTIPPLRKMPCSSRSFLMPRTWESSVWRSRSCRYFSLEPQMNSRSFLTCRLTNGVCWIIRYWKMIEEGWFLLNYLLTTPQLRAKVNSLHYLWQEIEPGVIKDWWRDARVGVCNFLDLVRQSEDHFGEELRVRLKHISSMTLKNTPTFIRLIFASQKHYVVLSFKTCTLTYWRRKKGLMSGGEEEVWGFRSWLVAVGSSSPCWVFQNSSRDLSTCRQ